MNGFPEKKMSEDAPSAKPIISIEKRCIKCKNVKLLSDFYKHTTNKNGLRNECKECTKIRVKKYNATHRKSIKETKKEYRINHLKKIKAADKQYYIENKEQIKAYKKTWYLKNSERIKYKLKKYYIENQEEILAIRRKYQSDNLTRAREIQNKASTKRRKTLKGKLSGLMGTRINNSLVRGYKASRHWETLVGYTIAQLKRHLEKQFTNGMTWENYGHYWHIDHIVPISAFNFEKPEDMDFKHCWALSNLQPLEANKNLRKNARLEKPFQPSLQLAFPVMAKMIGVPVEQLLENAEREPF